MRFCVLEFSTLF